MMSLHWYSYPKFKNDFVGNRVSVCSIRVFSQSVCS